MDEIVRRLIEYRKRQRLLLSESLDKYTYDGPVRDYNNNIIKYVKKETRAVSKEKAKSNIEYQVKKDLNMSPNMFLSIELDKIKLVTSVQKIETPTKKPKEETPRSPEQIKFKL